MEMGRQEFVGSLVIGEKIHINLDLSKAYNSISEGKVLSIPIYSHDFFSGCALFFPSGLFWYWLLHCYMECH